MTHLTESDIESLAPAWLEFLGWQVRHGPDIAPDTPFAERADYGEVILAQRLCDALARLNPGLPAEALEDAFHRLTHPKGATLEARNRTFHRMLVEGVPAPDLQGRIAPLFTFNELPVISGGLEARLGTLTAGRGSG
jgi:type I restriction enzyme R subunit